MKVAPNPGSRAAWVAAAFVAATLSLSSVAAAQSRLSLADRVTRLEQQAAQGQGGVALVNQVQALQSQVQQLQGQIEELQHQLQLLQDSNKAQYVDIDSRIARLEGRTPGTASNASVAGNANDQQMPDVQLGAQSSATVPAATTPPAVGSGNPQADYDRAFSALRNGDFAAASRLYSAFIQAYPDTPLTPNAYYWLGESYYGTQNYPVALDTFQKLLQRFPADAKAPGAMLKVGYCQYEMKDWSAARTTLTEVTRKFPDSQEARLAEGRLRALDLQAGH
ncbi:MAG TPA: tol-pal system protein YbgF [Rhodanobacteraceae bacterium]|nr:tol-pal system protein YbgF [Rhodanobacteraceae bacterium]